MADVFISCSGKSTAANAIADELDRAGISYWLAKRHIKPGQDFEAEIPKAIKNCKVFLLVLDEKSGQSEHVRNEIHLAFGRRSNHEAIDFLTFKTDDCKIPDDIQYSLSRFQRMDGNPPDAQHIQNLISRIAEILGVEISPEEPHAEEILPEEPQTEQSLVKEPKLKQILRKFIRLYGTSLLIPVMMAILIWAMGMLISEIYNFMPGHIEQIPKGTIELKHNDNSFVYTLNFETGVLTVSGKGSMPNYTYLYQDFGSYTNSPLWEWKDYIKHIKIDDGVTSIGEHAFRECNNLTLVDMPSSMTSIKGRAFYRCPNLTGITIPHNVTSIEEWAFGWCGNLQRVSISETTTIGKDAFSKTPVEERIRRES